MSTAVPIQPLGDRVLVKRLEAAEEKRGGIIIPDTAKEKPQEGEVVAVGTGGKDEKGNTVEFLVKAGDRVFLPKYGGTEVKLGEETYLIVSQKDILGILKA